MGKLIRSFLLAVLLSGLVALVEPPLRMALYTARLTTLPVPERLPITVDRVRPETLRNSWHAERATGRRHEGIDIFAPRGTPVRGTTEGVIVRIGDGGLGGRTVWVLGPGGQRHYYAHLERFADIFRGQRVAAGDLLGYVGNSGNARGTPPHLHYGVYTMGGAINPFGLLGRGGNDSGKSRPPG